MESLVTGQTAYYELLWSNFRRGNARRCKHSLIAGLRKSTPKTSAKSFVSDQRLLSRRLFSRLIQEISWIGTKATISSWTRYFLAGLERRVHRKQRLRPAVGLVPGALEARHHGTTDRCGLQED